MPRLVCGVVIAHYPENSAGNTWAFLNWVLGFREAGWDVWIVEHMAESELVWKHEKIDGQSVNELGWASIVQEFDLHSRATLFIDGKAANEAAFHEFAKSADVFVNLSGQFKLNEYVVHIPHRA